MKREERQRLRNNAWLIRTGFSFGKARAGGAPVPESAKEHFRRKPYSSAKIQVS